MSYYPLPILPFEQELHELIDIQYCSRDNINPIINKTLCSYLSNVKNCIDIHKYEWDKYKKYTNPYEYIHTVIPGIKQSICKLKPLSRSFFKMIEICRVLRILDGIGPKITTFHLAEGPGGFIEALVFLRNNKNDLYQGITLVDNTNISIPGWKKTKGFLEHNKNIVIDTGISGTGDLMLPENLQDFYERHHNTCDIVTGDGGFDFTIDFEHQEIISSKLILAQIAFAAACQAKGGCFILKIFDTFTKSSIDILCLLAMMYNSVQIFKPQSSRIANSEKYIICKGFRLSNSRKLVDTLFHVLQDFKSNECIKSILNYEPSCAFIAKLEECNAILGQQQIECITHTLSLIKSENLDRLEMLKRTHIQKCISWCYKYKLPFNRVQPTNSYYSRTNTFIQERSAKINETI